MSTTSRNRNLLGIIGILLLTNILVLGYFLWFKKPVSKPAEKERTGITELLEKEVGFTETQLASYKQLKDKQRENMRPMFEEMRRAKDSLYKMMGDSTVNDSIINQAAENIARRQKALDLHAFYHFKNVRTICTPDQREKYDSMILRMFRRMGKPPKPAEKK